MQFSGSMGGIDSSNYIVMNHFCTLAIKIPRREFLGRYALYKFCLIPVCIFECINW